MRLQDLYAKRSEHVAACREMLTKCESENRDFTAAELKRYEGLDGEIDKNMHVIAKEEVEVERLQEQLDRVVTRQAKHRNELTRLSTLAIVEHA